MKILLVNKFHYMKGGSERYYFTLADAFRKAGHEVIFFSMQDEKNIPCEQSKYFVSNASVSGGIKSKLNMVLHIAYSKEAYRNMTALLKAETPDLVILNLVHKQLTLSIIDAIKDYDPGLPVFWTMHDLIAVCPVYTMLDGNGNICEKCLSGDFSNCVKNRCVKGSRLMSKLSEHEAKIIRKRRWYDKVDLFICPSEFYQKKLQSAKFTRSDIVCMRNPLPPDTQFRLTNGSGGYVLYFGRLSAEKGIKTLIKAASATGRSLLILGTGPMEEELKRLAKGDKNIVFGGFKQGEELTKCIADARCVVLPSEWYENGPYSAMEAMALGKPLIVSDYGGLPELVEDGANGYIYHSEDGLRKSLVRIFELPKDEYDRMCECSLGRARTMFDWKMYISRLLELQLKYAKNKG